MTCALAPAQVNLSTTAEPRAQRPGVEPDVVLSLKRFWVGWQVQRGEALQAARAACRQMLRVLSICCASRHTPKSAACSCHQTAVPETGRHGCTGSSVCAVAAQWAAPERSRSGCAGSGACSWTDPETTCAARCHLRSQRRCTGWQDELWVVKISESKRLASWACQGNDRRKGQAGHTKCTKAVAAVSEQIPITCRRLEAHPRNF